MCVCRDQKKDAGDREHTASHTGSVLSRFIKVVVRAPDTRAKWTFLKRILSISSILLLSTKKCESAALRACTFEIFLVDFDMITEISESIKAKPLERLKQLHLEFQSDLNLRRN